jgi:hypothetical protein
VHVTDGYALAVLVDGESSAVIVGDDIARDGGRTDNRSSGSRNGVAGYEMGAKRARWFPCPRA